MRDSSCGCGRNPRSPDIANLRSTGTPLHPPPPPAHGTPLPLAGRDAPTTGTEGVRSARPRWEHSSLHTARPRQGERSLPNVKIRAGGGGGGDCSLSSCRGTLAVRDASPPRRTGGCVWSALFTLKVFLGRPCLGEARAPTVAPPSVTPAATRRGGDWPTIM